MIDIAVAVAGRLCRVKLEEIVRPSADTRMTEHHIGLDLEGMGNISGG